MDEQISKKDQGIDYSLLFFRNQFRSSYLNMFKLVRLKISHGTNPRPIRYFINLITNTDGRDSV
jgi:hypothetical protein